jgi:uncharacterized protein
MRHDSSAELERKLAAIDLCLDGHGRVAVAFSGGIDSTVVYALARRRLGNGAVAVTAVSPSLPADELAKARELVAEIGGEHVLLESHEVEDPRYLENSPLRCYFCKNEVYGLLAAWAREHGYDAVLDGTNADDRHDPRPGRKAAREQGIVSPLLEAGIGKEEVRAAARRLGLSNWDKPAMACLASRIPYGTRITEENLSTVERAERLLRGLDIRQARVRHHGEIARIEIAEPDFGKVIEAREKIVAGMRALGFTYVALDLAGYRSGSLNEMTTAKRDDGQRSLAFHPD